MRKMDGRLPQDSHRLMARRTNETAVLVNGWQPHSYVHDPGRPRTVILALYVEPEWLMGVSAGLGREWRAGLLRPSVRRRVPALKIGHIDAPSGSAGAHFHLSRSDHGADAT
jgi:hypothetical protein